jgi:rhamnosyltransferase
MKNIAGVIVLYNPVYDEIVRNIKSYLYGLDFFYIIDNSQQKCTDRLLTDINAGIPVEYIFNGSNMGISYSLNLAAKLAMAKGCNWLLTMDQDSYFENEQFNAYINRFEHDIKNNSSIGVAGVSYTHDNSKPLPVSNLVRTNKVITSGSIINLGIWKKIGGFDEKLVIDEVDHEYCYRVLANGAEVFFISNIFLCHVLGTYANKGYLNMVAKKRRMIYGKKRIYFIVRNYLYVRKKYIMQLPGEFKIRDKEVLGIIKNSLFFSGSFFGVVKSILIAYRDYKRNDFSAVL